MDTFVVTFYAFISYFGSYICAHFVSPFCLKILWIVYFGCDISAIFEGQFYGFYAVIGYFGSYLCVTFAGKVYVRIAHLGSSLPLKILWSDYFG